MADNVFGMVIGDEVVRAEDEYVDKKIITRLDRARVAFKKKHDGDKARRARECANALRSEWGWGTSTRCLLYNATGETLTFIMSFDWHGEIERDPYPLHIGNGQWGVFLHVRRGTLRGTSGAVVYRGKNADDMECDWMLAWHNPFDGPNYAYAEAREAGHYEKTYYWDYIWGLLRNRHHVDKWEGGTMTTVMIGQDTHAVYEAEMTLV